MLKSALAIVLIALSVAGCRGEAQENVISNAADAETTIDRQEPTAQAQESVISNAADAETTIDRQEPTAQAQEGVGPSADAADAETSADAAETDSAADADSAEPPTPADSSADADSAEPPTPADAAADPTSADPPIPAGPRFPEPIPLRIVRVAELEQPLAMAVRPGGDALYVALREGLVVRISVEAGGEPASGASSAESGSSVDAAGAEPGSSVDAADPRSLLHEVVLDLSERVVAHNELGLLGIAFSPDGRWLYTSSTAPGELSELAEWPVDGSGRIEQGGRRLVLSLQQPFGNHNGGDIAFGHDGYLYMAFGDGGGGGDPLRAGQDRSTWLGSVIRVDPRAAADGQPYAVPADNPYADGVDGAPEVWLWGVRNPWRISFDSATGDLWVADVGQDEVEEITRLPAKSGGAGADDGSGYTTAGRDANLGWSDFEGSKPYWSQVEPDGHVRPTHEYLHGVDGRCSVTGGYVYRGGRIPGLAGVYLFSDYCDSVIRGFTIESGTASLGLTAPDPVTSFGQGPDGEIYVMTSTALWRLEAR